MQGYDALREGAAWLDLSARGRLRATGEDRVRLLHAMSTNHIQELTAGSGCSAFFLNPQGRILAAARIYAFPDSLLLDTEPETRGFLYEHLDRYIIADDVTIEDVTDATVELGIGGPDAERVLAALGAPVPAQPWAHERWDDRHVLRIEAGHPEAFTLIAPASERDALIAQFDATGATRADDDAARVVRLETGTPRFGEDITDRHLPHETRVLSAVHFNKGCYIGQEIVERIRSRGGVHRFLVPLDIEGSDPVPAGAGVEATGKEVGEITSSAYSPARGLVVALGYLRRNEIPAGAALTVNSRAATVRQQAG